MHVHENANTSVIYQSVDKKRKVIIETKGYVILTGHYLRYDGGYAQMKGMTIGKMGSPKLKLFADKHDIHISC